MWSNSHTTLFKKMLMKRKIMCRAMYARNTDTMNVALQTNSLVQKIYG